MINDDATPSNCNHCQFGLIVTGQGEREFLPKFFRSLTKYAGCSFKVLHKIEQLGVIGEKRQQKMIGKGTLIPSKDAEIGIKVRMFLRDNPCHFVILIDDFEHDRIDQIDLIWRRYRAAAETLLRPDELPRFAVHFLANMLEAYYFADYKAVNQALGATLLTADLLKMWNQSDIQRTI